MKYIFNNIISRGKLLEKASLFEQARHVDGMWYKNYLLFLRQNSII